MLPLVLPWFVWVLLETCLYLDRKDAELCGYQLQQSVPCDYFLIDGLNGSERANIVNQ